MISRIFAGRRGLVLLLIIVAVVVVVVVKACGDDDGGNGTPTSTGPTAADFKEGACVKRAQQTTPGVPGTPAAPTSAFPEVVDCDNPEADGILHETDNFENCPQEQQGIQINVIGGERLPEGKGAFCIEQR